MKNKIFIVLGVVSMLSVALFVLTNTKIVKYNPNQEEKQEDKVITDKETIDSKDKELSEEKTNEDNTKPSNKESSTSKVDGKNNTNNKTENNNKKPNNKTSISNKNEQPNKESNNKNENNPEESGVVGSNNTNKPTDNVVTVEDKPWELLKITKEDYYNKPVYKWARVDYPVSSCTSVSNCESLCMKDAEELSFTENVSCIQIYTYSGKYLGEMLSKK